jgi:hypothetical protein
MPEAAREFEVLDSTVKERVEAALDQLALAPLSLRNQIKRLKGQTSLRLRVSETGESYSGSGATKSLS